MLMALFYAHRMRFGVPCHELNLEKAQYTSAPRKVSYGCGGVVFRRTTVGHIAASVPQIDRRIFMQTAKKSLSSVSDATLCPRST
jgi:hypothetical protein